MGALIDLAGQRFGRLTVIERAENRGTRTYWTCRCDCGAVVDRQAAHFRGRGFATCGTACLAGIGKRPWPRNPRYLAGEDGSIAGPGGQILRPRPNTHGYLTVDVFVEGQFRTRTVHSIVCEAFHGLRPEGLEVAHGDGVQENCRPENLRWATSVENAADRDLHGTTYHGEGHHKARLTPDQVREIRIASAAGVSRRSLATRFGVSKRAIQFIISGRNWRRVA